MKFNKKCMIRKYVYMNCERMNRMARVNHKENYFIRTLNGLSYGYFTSVIMGLLLKQLGIFIHWSELTHWGQMIGYLMGPMIGLGIAYVTDAKGMNMLCALIAGTIGAGTFQVNQGGVSVHVGQPLTAYIAVVLSIELIRLIQDKIPFDLFLIPFISVVSAGLIAQFIGPYISQFISWLGFLINEGVHMHPIFMSIVISLLMGILLTSPISTIAMGTMLGLRGLAAGAALAGCCAQMVGLAIMSIDDNSLGDVFAIGIGSSQLQFKNIVKRPIIWIPPILSSIVSGFISTVVLKIQCTPLGSGVGTTAFVGFLESISIMGSKYWLPLLLVDLILPMTISWSLYRMFRKLNYIRSGDLKLTKLY